MLQEGDGTEIGWLFYSTREVDTGTLTDEIMDINGINIGLRWKVINSRAKMIPKENMIGALSVESSAKAKTQCAAKLLQLYCRHMKLVKEYHNEICLRFIKNRSSEAQKSVVLKKQNEQIKD